MHARYPVESIRVWAREAPAVDRNKREDGNRWREGGLACLSSAHAIGPVHSSASATAAAAIDGTSHGAARAEGRQRTLRVEVSGGFS